MKFYLSYNIREKAGAKNILNRLGISYTGIANNEATNFFVTKNPEFTTIINGIEDLQSVLGTHKGNTSNWIASKIGLTSKHDLADKLKTYQTVNSLGLPNIDTIFPTTEQEVRDFFATHGEVFCKPRLGYNSAAPVTNLLDLIPSINIQNVTVEERDSYFSTIPVPSSTEHFYKKYTSADQLFADISVSDFLSIQNSEKALLIHQCVLQDVFHDTDGKLEWVQIVGFTNGSSDVMYEPYYLRSAEWSAPSTELINLSKTPSLRNVSPSNFSAVSGKLTVDYNAYTKQQIIDMINSTVDQDLDTRNIASQLKQIFTQSEVKNTFFTAQGHINNDGNVVWHDFATSTAAQFFKRTYVSDEVFLNRFKFISDEAHDASKLKDNTKRYFFTAECPSGLTTELAALAASKNILFVYPATLGFQNLSLTAFGTDAEVIAQNVKDFLAACAA